MTPLQQLHEEGDKEFEIYKNSFTIYDKSLHNYVLDEDKLKYFIQSEREKAFTLGQISGVELAEGCLKDTEEYIAVKDNDTHRYQIPKSKKGEWDIFCDIPSDDEASWDVPEWAERLDGMPLTSFKDTSLTNLSDLKQKIQHEKV